MNDELKQLSVRILNSKNEAQGSGLLYIQNKNTAYILTAAHVLNNYHEDDTIFVECQPDKTPVGNTDQNNYMLELPRTNAYSQFGLEQCPKSEWRADDAAIIYVNAANYPWMNARRRVMFAGPGNLTSQAVTGGVYSLVNSKDSMNWAIKILNPEKSRCITHDEQDHKIAWKFNDLAEYTETALQCMSGSILALSDAEQIVLAGIFLGHQRGTSPTEIRGADLSCMRKLLADQKVAVHIYGEEKLDSLENRSRPVPTIGKTPRNVAAVHAESRNKELADLKAILEHNTLIHIGGMAGIGKTTVANALTGVFSERKCIYLDFKDSDAPNEVLRKTIEEAQFPEEYQSFKQRIELLKEYADRLVLIIDNFSYPGNDPKTLEEDESFLQLCGLTDHGMKLVLITTGPPEQTGYEIEAMPTDVLWKIWEEKCTNSNHKISKTDFHELIHQTGGHTKVTELIINCLTDSLATPNLSEIKESIKAGRFDCLEGGEAIAQYLEKKFPLGDYASVMHLATNISVDGMSMDLFAQGLSKDENEKVRKCIASGWLKKHEGVLTVPPIIRLLCPCKYDRTDCSFAHKIWKKAAFDFASNPDNAMHFAEYISRIQEQCADHSNLRCPDGSCWCDMAKAYLWQITGDNIKKCEAEKTQHVALDNLTLGAWGDEGEYNKAILDFSQKVINKEQFRAAMEFLRNRAKDNNIKARCAYQLGVLWESDDNINAARTEFEHALEWSTWNEDRLMSNGHIARICDRTNHPDALTFHNNVAMLFNTISSPDKDMKNFAATAFFRLANKMAQSSDKALAASYYCKAIHCANQEQYLLLANCHYHLALHNAPLNSNVAKKYAATAVQCFEMVVTNQSLSNEVQRLISMQKKRMNAILAREE